MPKIPENVKEDIRKMYKTGDMSMAQIDAEVKKKYGITLGSGTGYYICGCKKASGGGVVTDRVKRKYNMRDKTRNTPIPVGILSAADFVTAPIGCPHAVVCRHASGDPCVHIPICKFNGPAVVTVSSQKYNLSIEDSERLLRDQKKRDEMRREASIHPPLTFALPDPRKRKYTKRSPAEAPVEKVTKPTVKDNFNRKSVLRSKDHLQGYWDEGKLTENEILALKVYWDKPYEELTDVWKQQIIDMAIDVRIRGTQL